MPLGGICEHSIAGELNITFLVEVGLQFESINLLLIIVHTTLFGMLNMFDTCCKFIDCFLNEIPKKKKIKFDLSL